ncbi:MAG TPA: class I SAM-dependent methyltransferase [Ktedonobacteraceae bacterium]
MSTIVRFWADIISSVLTRAIAPITRKQINIGRFKLPLTFRVWDSFEVTPILHHFYQPVFNPHDLAETTWTKADPLYGIDMNVPGQLTLLRSFAAYSGELQAIPISEPSEGYSYFYNNTFFESGDAEILYSMVRHFKPKKVVEIGSGYSTRLIKRALDKNREEGAVAEQICVEPYSNPWLEQLGVDKIIRSKVEDIDLSLFDELEEDCLLIIDSSHTLRTGGDVYIEYLHILPRLQKGVIIHIHDIFLPFDYPRQWVVSERRFYTEQYLFQAFLAFNPEFEILAALKFLATYHFEEFAAVCPVFAQQLDRRLDPENLTVSPSSFWIRRK